MKQSEKCKGVWILSVPTVYTEIYTFNWDEKDNNQRRVTDEPNVIQFGFVWFYQLCNLLTPGSALWTYFQLFLLFFIFL